MAGDLMAEMNAEQALPEFLDTLRWRWKLVLLVFVAVAAGSVVYAESLPEQYKVEAIVSVAPRTAEVSPTAVTVGAPKYVAYATAPSTVAAVASRLGEDPDAVRGAIDAALAPETGDITISAEGPRPDRSVRVANAFAAATVSFSTTDNLLRATLTAPAARPSAPTGPPRRLIEGAALVVALVLAVGTALVFERVRPPIRTWGKVAELTGFPVVGRIPRSKSIRASPPKALADPVVGPSVRVLRTNLERELNAPPRGVMVVTSSVPGEGKTAVASVIATSIAQLGTRVLLIDGDLHRAGLSQRLGRQHGDGVSTLLRGLEGLEDKIVRACVPGLWVLTTGISRDAGDLVAHGFKGLAEEARTLFDLVVVDTTPLLGSDLSAAIATVADGTVLVVSAGTPPDSVSEAVAALQALRVPVWGVVANRLRTSLAYGYPVRGP
jgi:succinoglycan biosynthesis transport protein ExoP